MFGVCGCPWPGITPGEIAEALGLTRGAVSKIIDKLEAKSWITRSTKPEDSRVQLLSLTRSGTRILPQLAKIADENDRESFAVLDPTESATLRRLLGKLADFHHSTHQGEPYEQSNPEFRGGAEERNGHSAESRRVSLPRRDIAARGGDSEPLVPTRMSESVFDQTFPEFLAASWRAGVVRYDVDFASRTVTYYGCNGEEYVEAYPAVQIEA